MYALALLIESVPDNNKPSFTNKYTSITNRKLNGGNLNNLILG